MSDRFSRMLAEYAAAVEWEQLPEPTVHEVKRRVLDSLGVALAAFAEPAPKAARAYAYHWPLVGGATLWGTNFTAPVEAAALCNGVMVRYLDFNDTYLSQEPLHPSDTIAALWALAEWRDLPARDFLLSVAVAYEVGVNLCDAASLRRWGWDHVNYIGVATAAAAGRLLGLPVEAIEHAISLACVPHAAMRQTRAGELSMWKGAAAANAARHALFGALLAEAGMTGPFQPFEGEMGFFRQLLGGQGFAEQALRGLRDKRPPRRILDTYIKYWPVEYHAQSAVDAALQLRAELHDPGRIASVRIATFRAAYEIIAKDPEKWEPKTRETADHSLPYIVVVALLDGRVDRSSFSPARFTDPEVRRMLKERTELEEDPELTAGYPDGIPNRIEVRTHEGQVFTREVRYPRGHAKNPLSDAEVVNKFRA
ncbi:MAG: MmgE/PrpD family protein, partial [Armatimonadota bacterium]|nr:MmgE/PrpD family protein [Armatimonadota bacterium]